MTATRHSPLTDSPPDAGAPARALTLSEGVTDGQGDAMDDGRLVLALRAHDPAAAALLFDRYAPHVRRILARVMGFDAELADLLHDVFVAALGSIHTLHQPERLKAWLTSIAVFTARRCIRRRRARRWLFFMAPQELPELTAVGADPATAEALRVTYRILAEMPADLRIVFSLRCIDGLELTEVAAACDVSLATIKRRQQRARAWFDARAAVEPALVGFGQRREP